MIATTTLNEIRKHHPCENGWTKLLKNLGKTKADDQILTLQTVLESNGMDDALWCLGASDAPEFEIRKFARCCALDVAHLWDMPAIVRAYLETGNETKRATAEAAAWAAARAAARAAQAAGEAAARAAARAAQAAGEAAAWGAAGAARASRAARQKQTARFIEMFCTEETP
jgi:hypothetical protein